jgi:citrate lyase subunit alpha / citrate CoA-transferase
LDLEAVSSIVFNPNHLEASASFYANPFNSGCVANKLDCVILGATGVDTSFNVNVVIGSHGMIMGGSGGHSDTAAGAKLATVVARLLYGDLPIVTDEVLTATTPGETIDVLVTEGGVAVNPRRDDLKDRLTTADLPVQDITDLKPTVDRTADTSQPLVEKIVAVVEYRDGTVIDVVRQVAK